MNDKHIGSGNGAATERFGCALRISFLAVKGQLFRGRFRQRFALLLSSETHCLEMYGIGGKAMLQRFVCSSLLALSLADVADLPVDLMSFQVSEQVICSYKVHKS